VALAGTKKAQATSEAEQTGLLKMAAAAAEVVMVVVMVVMVVMLVATVAVAVVVAAAAQEQSRWLIQGGLFPGAWRAERRPAFAWEWPQRSSSWRCERRNIVASRLSLFHPVF
jgi:hypothetical protein